MGIFENTPPKWDAKGTEPSADLQTNGFTAGYKPPAAYFNYLFNMYTKCLKELQKLAEQHDQEIVDILGFINEDDVSADNPIQGIYAKKSTSHNIVLPASNWESNTYYHSITFSLSGNLTEKNIEVVLPSKILTAEELAAFQNAQILTATLLYVDTADVTQIILECYGTKPTIDLNVVVIIRGD